MNGCAYTGSGGGSRWIGEGAWVYIGTEKQLLCTN